MTLVSVELPTTPPTTDRDRLYWAVWAVIAAFGTYFCMYAFRKPYTAATFDNSTVLWLSLKDFYVATQVMGYMLSKFIGIKVISEMPPNRRAGGIFALVLVAEAALVLFALVPSPWNACGLFLNGLALGMVFGLVLGFLEGRQSTEALTAGLCASFILADGVTKSVGTWLLQRGVSEYWMPSAAGVMFLAPLGIGAWMLSRIPSPGRHDVVARAARTPLNRSARWSLYGRYALGLSMIITMYLAVTVLRSLRADFAPEIWRGLGSPPVSGTFTWSEILVALGVLVVNGSAIFIRANQRAFFAALSICGFGLVLVAAALIGMQAGRLSGFAFMVIIGLGLYFPYVAVHTTLFERLLAMTRERGNIGFLMYMADSIGYLGYVAVMILRGAVTRGSDFLQFFSMMCWIACGISLVCLALSWRYFAVRSAAPELAPAAEGAV